MLNKETLSVIMHVQTGKCQAVQNAIEIVKSSKTFLPNLSTAQYCTVWYYDNHYTTGYWQCGSSRIFWLTIDSCDSHYKQIRWYELSKSLNLSNENCGMIML